VNPLARLAAFALVLALLFGGGVAVGAAVGPLDEQPRPQLDTPTGHEGHP
jgi:hypothetical protein